MKKVLTIAGSDSGGGAGIQADLKTMTVLGVFGMSAITALTAQNTLGVSGIYPVTPDFLDLQLEAVLGDLGADAVKTGMLFSSALIRVAGRRIREKGIDRLVVDPVMVSKSGHRLLEEEAVDTLVGELLPLAMAVTPNLPEAEILSGIRVSDIGSMKKSAEIIRGLGPRCVIVKGGHLAKGAPDVFFDGSARIIRGERVGTGPVHGTGCTFSAALASYLALGHAVYEAAVLAKKFVTGAIEAALPLGGGHPPANQLFGLSG